MSSSLITKVGVNIVRHVSYATSFYFGNSALN